MAIIYEVNLKIAHTIAQPYLNWLREHIQEMLHFSGFQQATLCQEMIPQEESQSSNEINLVVQYQIATMDDLNHYLQHHAQTMREKAKDLFKDQFHATRRILFPL